MPILARSVRAVPGRPPRIDPFRDSRALQLETYAGDIILPFDTPEWIILPGIQGLGLPPVSVGTESAHGVDGGYLTEISVEPREVFLPLFLASDTSHAAHLAQLATLRRVLDHRQVSDPSAAGGTHLLVARTPAGERVLTVAYTGGMEGQDGWPDSGAHWATFGLNLIAVDPYWRARGETSRAYQTAAGDPFLGDGTGTEDPWPRSLAPSNVLGEGTEIRLDSDVPTWVDLDIVGPCDSATLTADTGIAIDVPGGVAEGSTLTIVTDPRRTSARLDGAAAWSAIGLGSVIAPLQPGVNLVDVALEGATDATRLVVRYRAAWETPW